MKSNDRTIKRSNHCWNFFAAFLLILALGCESETDFLPFKSVGWNNTDGLEMITGIR